MNQQKSKIALLLTCVCLLGGLFAESSFSKSRNAKQVLAKTEFSEEEKQYAQCLQEKGITMYGTSWCPHCKEQKAVFGELFNQVNYVDCDKDPKTCRDKKITGYPTWLLPSGKEVDPGTIADVAKASGCTLAKNSVKKEDSASYQAEPSNDTAAQDAAQ